MTILCTIDLLTREVSLPGDQRIAAYDHNVDVIHFQAEPIEDFSLDTSSIKIAAQGPNNVRHDYAVDPSTVQIEEETGYITFDWPIPQGVTEMPIGTGFKYGDKGQLIFSVCAEIISGSTLSKAWHSDDGIITVVAHLEPEAGGGEDPSETATNAQKIAQLQTDVAVINTQVGALANGSPTPVSTVAEMTDESAVYLYTGSETGYTAGNWYYYNGSAWTSGGTYGGAVTDTTLSIRGSAADSKTVGDALALKADSADVTALDTRVTAVEGDVSDLREDLNYDIRSIKDVVEFTHTETTTAGSHVFTFPARIPKDTVITFTNTNETGAMTVNLRDAEGNESNFGSVNAGSSITITTPFDTVAIRNYISGTDWGIKVTYGGDIEKIEDDIDGIEENIDVLFSNIKSDVVFASNTVSKLIENGFSITTSDKIVYIVFDRNKTSKSFDSIAEELGSTYATISGNTLLVTLPPEGCLCYDTINNIFVMRTNMNTIPNGCIVLAWRYYQLLGGRMYDHIRIISNYNEFENVSNVDILPVSAAEYSLISGGFAITNSSSLYVCFNGAKTSVPYTTIATQLGSNYATVTENGIEITLPPEGYFCYDIISNTFKMVTNVIQKTPTLILLAWRYYQQLGGYFYERIRSIVDNNDAISRNNNLITELSKDTFNASYYSGMRNWQDTAESFASLFVGVEKCESFLFFTDPHTQFDPWSAKWEEYMCQLQKMYRSTPCNFVLCGGDWLGLGDTLAEACYRLGIVKATCKSMLDPCYMLVGNHDTNVQSVRLPNYTISNLWYDGKEAYYSFDGVNTKFYCFNTGGEADTLTDLNNYGLNQALWFASALTTETSAHIALAMHIYYKNFTTEAWNDISHQIMLIASAYNRRSSITVGTDSFNYSDATGKIEFVIAGHSHADLMYRYTENGCDIPVVVTLDTGNDTSFRDDASFDLVFVNYDDNVRKLYCVRAGVGNDREIALST